MHQMKYLSYLTCSNTDKDLKVTKHHSTEGWIHWGLWSWWLCVLSASTGLACHNVCWGPSITHIFNTGGDTGTTYSFSDIPLAWARPVSTFIYHLSLGPICRNNQSPEWIQTYEWTWNWVLDKSNCCDFQSWHPRQSLPGLGWLRSQCVEEETG